MNKKIFTLMIAILASIGMICAKNSTGSELIYRDSIRITFVPPTTFIYDTFLVVAPNPYVDKYAGDIVIPDSVEINGRKRCVVSIGAKAFKSCVNVTSVTIPNTITTIGEQAFFECNGLTSIVLPESLKNLCNYAFDGCFYLVSVNIPSSLTKINRGAFGRCHSLQSLVIPSTITHISDYSFYECIGLTSVTCYAVNPPIMGGANVFDQYVDCSKIPLYVPEESVEAYKAADEWKEFNPILPIDTQDVEQVSQQPTAKSQKLIKDGQVLILRGDNTYTLQGQEMK